MFIDFWLGPVLLLCVEDEDIVDDALFAITLASAKNQEELAELGGGVAVAS